jgi:hypothetical protein
VALISRITIDNTTNSGEPTTDCMNESLLCCYRTHANQQEDSNGITGTEVASIARVGINTNTTDSGDILDDGLGIIELSGDEEVYKSIPDSTKMEWLKMQELQRQEDQRAKLEAEQQLATIRIRNEGRQVTRQLSGTQEVMHCQFCNLAGDNTYADYISKWEQKWRRLLSESSFV